MLQQLKFGVVLAAFLSSPIMALAQTMPAVPPNSLVEETSVSLDSSGHRGRSTFSTWPELPESQQPSCPAGYFASKFPDVMPSDWAYEAVNRLADQKFRCFPRPLQNNPGA